MKTVTISKRARSINALLEQAHQQHIAFNRRPRVYSG